MDEAIIQHIKRRYNLLIGERTAELIKMTIGNAYPSDELLTMDIKGRDLVAGRAAHADRQLRRGPRGARRAGHAIVEAVKRARSSAHPPSSPATIADRGIVLAGGGALLKASMRCFARRRACRCSSPRTRSARS